MKKLIYTLFIVFSGSLLFTSCTEEEVAPVTQTAKSGVLFGDEVAK